MATYPTSPALAEVTNATAVDPTWGESIRENINAIGADLVDGRGDGQTFPGTDHTSGQSTDIDDALQAIRHILSDISGETNWYDDAAGSLKVHDHTVGEGGAIVWAALGGNARFREIHPEYPGAVSTLSLHGGAASGANTVTNSTGQDVVSNVGHNYYESTSAETSLQDRYIALRFTLPEEFTAWAVANAIQVEYRTEHASYVNCGVEVYIHKSGGAGLIASAVENASTTWANITIDDSDLGAWSAGDIMEIYIKLESRNDYFARCGSVIFNFTS